MISVKDDLNRMRIVIGFNQEVFHEVYSKVYEETGRIFVENSRFTTMRTVLFIIDELKIGKQN